VKEKRLTTKERLEEKKRKLEVERRFLDKNFKAMKFCFSHNLTIYPALQTDNSLKLFVQHHEHFEELNGVSYDQSNLNDQIEMVAAIDFRYEEFYKKHKSKGLGRFRNVDYTKTATD
tara:strand:+ start:761 stop:1111 length:351 start_codon:yes stop_codon:yes gene_type:complete